MAKAAKQPYKRKAPTKPKPKSNTKWWLGIGVLILLLLAGGLFYYLKVKEDANETILYDAFGIEIPKHYSIHGIDVSAHQETIHWKNVKEMAQGGIKIGFAFIKATEGMYDCDKRFDQNWKHAKQVQMTCGAYHYFIATRNGRAQAQNFINHVVLEKGDLPPVLDIEELYGASPQAMRGRVKEWLDIIEKYYHITPIIYSNVDFYENYLGEDFEKYPLWVAHYFEREKPRITRNFTIWQHNENGHVDGIRHPVDFSVFNGDSTTFKKLLIP